MCMERCLVGLLGSLMGMFRDLGQAGRCSGVLVGTGRLVGRVRAGVSVAGRFPGILLCLWSVVPVVWFRSGLAVFTPDSFYKLNPAGSGRLSLYVWDARSSFGQVVVNVPAALLNEVQSGLHGIVGLVGTEIIVTVGCSMAAVFGARRALWLLAGAPGGRGGQRERWGSVSEWSVSAGAMFWVANPFALAFVWWHQLLIEATWAVVPWLVVLLVETSRGARRLNVMVVSTVLVTCLGSAGLPEAYLPAVALLLAAVGAEELIRSQSKIDTVLRIVVFGVAFAVGISWWLVPSIGLLHSLVGDATAQGVSSLSQLRYASRFSGVANAISLADVPQLYTGVGTAVYVNWHGLVTSALGQIVRFVAPGLCLAGAIVGIRRRQTRWPIAIEIGVLTFGVLVSAGLAGPFADVERSLVSTALGSVIRHPVDKVAVVVVFCFCILFVRGTQAVLSWNRPVGAAVLVVVLGVLGSPWWTGAVVPTGGGVIPSSYVAVPSQYKTVGKMLSRMPAGGKTFVAPYSPNGGSAFNWPSGVQPNQNCLLQEWAPSRSTICASVGSQYPDLAGNTLAEGLASANSNVFDLARILGVDSWLVHLDWASAYLTPAPVSPVAAMSTLTNPNNQIPNGMAILQPGEVSPPTSRVDIVLKVTRIPGFSYDVARWGPFRIQVNKTKGARQAYVAIYDVADGGWWPGPTIGIGQWTAIQVSVDTHGLSFQIGGVPNPYLVAFCECGKSKLRGVVGEVRNLKYLPAIPQRNALQIAPSIASDGILVVGARKKTVPRGTGLARVRPTAVQVGQYLAVFSQPAMPLVYAAKDLVPVSGHTSASLLAAAGRTETMDAPALVDPSVARAAGRLDPSVRDSWSQLSPTNLRGTIDIHGTTSLIFGQSFSSDWRLEIVGAKGKVLGHFVANGVENGWLVSGDGQSRWVLTFAPQSSMMLGFYAGIAVACLCIVYLSVAVLGRRLWRRDLRDE